MDVEPLQWDLNRESQVIEYTVKPKVRPLRPWLCNCVACQGEKDPERCEMAYNFALKALISPQTVHFAETHFKNRFL